MRERASAPLRGENAPCLDCRAMLAMTGGDGRSDVALSLRDTWRASSLRGAKRRSNPDGEGRHAGLPRSARSDGG
ncbi:MAG: hypothetical protein LBT00_00125 [Spirochaetaceae bacterium]|nr:hypothetical protein [Spirochaetaceae bacterium]